MSGNRITGSLAKVTKGKYGNIQNTRRDPLTFLVCTWSKRCTSTVRAAWCKADAGHSRVVHGCSTRCEMQSVILCPAVIIAVGNDYFGNLVSNYDSTMAAGAPHMCRKLSFKSCVAQANGACLPLLCAEEMLMSL